MGHVASAWYAKAHHAGWSAGDTLRGIGITVLEENAEQRQEDHLKRMGNIRFRVEEVAKNVTLITQNLMKVCIHTANLMGK